MPDIASIVISILVAIVIAFLCYWFLLKPSSETVSSNISTIQTSIDELTKSLSSSNVNIKDITSNVIPTLQTTITTSIDAISQKLSTLSSNTDAKSAEFTASIEDLKTANNNLTKTTTQSITGLQDKIDTLQKSFDNFVTSQAAEIKRIDDKEKTDFSLVKTLIASLTSKGTDDKAELLKLIQDLAAQEKADMDTLSKKFPEINSTISQLKDDSQKTIDKIQKQLDSNDANDFKYKSYVDTINSYIDNAMGISEISDKVKMRIFSKKEDKALAFIKSWMSNIALDSNGRPLREFKDQKVFDSLREQWRANIEKKTGYKFTFDSPNANYKASLYIGKNFPETDEEANDLLVINDFLGSPGPEYNAATNTIKGGIVGQMMKFKELVPLPSVTNDSASYEDLRKFSTKYWRYMFNDEMRKKMVKIFNMADDIIIYALSDINTLFPEDYAMEYFNIESEEGKSNYLLKMFNQITGCNYKGRTSNDNLLTKLFSMIQKDVNNKELYEILWLWLFVQYGYGDRDMIYSQGKFSRNYSKRTEDNKPRAIERDKEANKIFNNFLNYLGLPSIVVGPYEYNYGEYSYANTKLAVLKGIKMSFTDCENLAKAFNDPAMTAEMLCYLKTAKFSTECPINTS